MKRAISVLLAALLSVSLLSPVYALRGPADQGPDSWAAIERIERQAGAEADLQSLAVREAAYAGSVDRMIRAVEAAPDYMDGSLIRHGDFFFWETADGRVNGYSPSLRAEISLQSRSEPADAAAPTDGAADGQAEPNVPDARDVGVMVPYSGSYYFCVDKAVAEGQALARSTGGSLHVCTAENSSVDTLAQLLQTCGIVLINSHGRTDYEVGEDHTSKANSSYLCLPTDAGFTAQDWQRVTGPYGSYYHAFYAGASEDFDEEYYCVDGTCIANHMEGSAPHSMVWLGLCLGMATEGLEAPLREKGVEAMIGFSERVISTTDQDYRLYFGQALLEDCTAGEAAAYMKQKVGCPDPIDVGHERAWPIAVSSQDPYPGRDHLTEGQEVLSTWKLHPAYPIAVTVEPAGTAEVKVVRTTVEVTPHRGYEFSDWEITEGEASAVRTNDTLSFDLSGPAAVTLRMTARTPARVQFSAGPGQTAAAIHEFIGDTVELPAPEGSLDADAYLYHFLGWSTAELPEDSPDAPALFPSGYRLKLTQAETDLYAVYGYFAAEDGVSPGTVPPGHGSALGLGGYVRADLSVCEGPAGQQPRHRAEYHQHERLGGSRKVRLLRGRRLAQRGAGGAGLRISARRNRGRAAEDEDQRELSCCDRLQRAAHHRDRPRNQGRALAHELDGRDADHHQYPLHLPHSPVQPHLRRLLYAQGASLASDHLCRRTGAAPVYDEAGPKAGGSSLHRRGRLPRQPLFGYAGKGPLGSRSHRLGGCLRRDQRHRTAYLQP